MIKYIFRHLFKDFEQNDLTAYAAEITYYLLLSIFPFLFFLMAVFSHSSLANQPDFLQLEKIIPQNVVTFIDSIMAEINSVNAEKFLSLTALIAIWSASKGVRAIMKGMNKAYKTKETRSILMIFAISFIYTIALVFVILVAMVLVVFGNKLTIILLVNFNFPWLYTRTLNFLRFTIPITFMFIIFLLIYKAAPNRMLKIRNVYPGAIFATITSYIASQIFSFYIDNFADFSILYGSIGSIVVLMLWFYLLSIILMFGAEINALLFKYHEENPQKIEPKK